MTPTAFETYPQPEWNEPDSVPTALQALGRVVDSESAVEACDRFLWAVGNNDLGTFHPVVLAALPPLADLLRTGSPWQKQAVIEVLLDLGGTFIPEPGHETHEGASVQQRVRAFIQSMKELVLPMTQESAETAASATQLLELIDDQSADPAAR